MSFFAGASGTGFGGTAAGSTAPTKFSRPEGTAAQRPSQAAPVPTPPAGLNEWLKSDDARRLAGQWVMLSDDFSVLDSAPSPSELLKRHPEEAAPRIVLVDPPGVQFAV